MGPGSSPRCHASFLASAQSQLQGQPPGTWGRGPLRHLKLANRLLAGDLKPENEASKQTHTKGVSPPALGCAGLTHSTIYCPSLPGSHQSPPPPAQGPQALSQPDIPLLGGECLYFLEGKSCLIPNAPSWGAVSPHRKGDQPRGCRKIRTNPRSPGQ